MSLPRPGFKYRIRSRQDTNFVVAAISFTNQSDSTVVQDLRQAHDASHTEWIVEACTTIPSLATRAFHLRRSIDTNALLSWTDIGKDNLFIMSLGNDKDFRSREASLFRVQWTDQEWQWDASKRAPDGGPWVRIRRPWKPDGQSEYNFDGWRPTLDVQGADFSQDHPVIAWHNLDGKTNQEWYMEELGQAT